MKKSYLVLFISTFIFFTNLNYCHAQNPYELCLEECARNYQIEMEQVVIDGVDEAQLLLETGTILVSCFELVHPLAILACLGLDMAYLVWQEVDMGIEVSGIYDNYIWCSTVKCREQFPDFVPNNGNNNNNGGGNNTGGGSSNNGWGVSGCYSCWCDPAYCDPNNNVIDNCLSCECDPFFCEWWFEVNFGMKPTNCSKNPQIVIPGIIGSFNNPLIITSWDENGWWDECNEYHPWD